MNTVIRGYQRRSPIASRSAAATAAVVMAAAVAAHDFSASESILTIDGAIVRSRLSVNLLELPDVDTNRDERISYEELDKAIEPVFRAIKEHYTLTAPDIPSAIVADRSEIVDEHVLQMDIRYSFGHPVTQLDVTSTLDRILGVKHQHVASMKIDGEFRRDVLDASHSTAHFDLRRVTASRMLAVALAALGLIALAAYRWLGAPAVGRK